MSASNLSDELVDVQVKMAWLENQVAELDAVVRSLGDALERVRAEVKELREAEARRAEQGEHNEDDDGGIQYEKPPHY